MNTIRIINNLNQEFDYYSVEDLGLLLNKVVDDYTQIDKRFSEFSYQFSLPKTKNNAIIFNHSDVHNVINKFVKNKQECSVYLNSTLLFKGVIELDAIGKDDYYCTLLSRVSEIIDLLGEKELVDLQFNDPDFNYETTVLAHVHANYKNSDEADFQFPFIYYSTFQTPAHLYNDGAIIDQEGYEIMMPDRPMQNFYNLINGRGLNPGEINAIYYHQIPVALYLKTTLEQIFKEIGWGLSGSIFDTEEFKKIIIPYTGQNDIYNNSLYCTNNGELDLGGVCTQGTLKLKLSNFLPDMTCVEFLNNVINFFNLYFEIDINNKIINFETYDTLFSNKSNPIVLDYKIDENSVEYKRILNNNPSIMMRDADNKMIYGDNYYQKLTDSNNPYSAPLYKIAPDLTNDIYNKIGDKEQESIELDFTTPIIKRTYIWSKYLIDNFHNEDGWTCIYQPCLTKQTRQDNNNMVFNKDDSETNVDNEPNRVKYDGFPTLMYYYGISNNDEIQNKGYAAWRWFYINFHGLRMKIPFASPFGYIKNRSRINTVVNDNDAELKEKVYASFLQSIYKMMGDNYDSEIKYSLIMSDLDTFPTAYTKFHSKKYRRYTDGYELEADIRMDINDYNQMKMSTPLSYKQEIYSLLSIKDFDPVNNIAKISLIKQ